MKLSAAIYAFLVTALLGLDAAAQDGTLAAKVRRWQADLRGDIKVDDSGISGTSIDVDSTLGFDSTEDFDELHVSMKLPIIGGFNFQYMRGGFEGTSLLTSDITFGGTTFTASTQVDSELDFETYTLLWQFGATTPGVIGGGMAAGAIAGIKYFDIHAEIHDNFGNSEDADVNAPVPVIGAYVRLSLLKFLSVEAQVHGIKYFDTFNLGVEGTFYDATIAVDVKVMGLFAGAGYRFYHLDFEYDDGSDAEVEFDLEGLFFEAGFSF